jgi:hypothetical protein
MLYIGLAISSNLLSELIELGQNLRLSVLTRIPLAHQLVWTSSCLVRRTPRYSHYISRAAYALPDGDSEHL